MPAKTHVKTIGKHQYQYIQMTMTPAVELLSLLSTTAGEALAPLSKLGKGELSLDADIDAGVIAKCVTALLAKIGKSADVLELIERINKQGMVVIVGKDAKVPMDLANYAEIHFGEHFDELPGWLTFALGAQFSPFFASLLPSGIASAAKAMMAKAKGQTSPITSEIAGPS